MKKKDNLILDVVNFLFILIVGAMVIDLVLALACKQAAYSGYYHRHHERIVIAFEVFIIAAFVAGKAKSIMQTLRVCKGSFSFKSFLYGIVSLFFLAPAVLSYSRCIKAILEDFHSDDFLYIVIALATCSCLSAYFFNGYLRERLNAQEKMERKSRVIITDEDLTDDSVHINWKRNV